MNRHVCLRVGAVLAALLMPTVARAQAPSILENPLQAIANKVASTLGGQCWAVASIQVQVFGLPMCLNTTNAQPYFEEGRHLRVDMVKALGLTFAMFTGRSTRQDMLTAHETRLERMEKVFNVALGNSVVVPSAAIRTYVQPLPQPSTAYQLSTVALLDLTAPPASPQGPTFQMDPVGAALAARSMAVANALDHTAASTMNAVAAREQGIQSGTATAAEATRLDVEANAIQTYLSGATAQTQAQQQQMEAYQTLRTELQHQVHVAALMPAIHRIVW